MGLAWRGCVLHDFENLEELALSHTTTGTDARFMAGLLAPRLRVFRWDLMREDRQLATTPDHFDQNEEDWLRALGR
ncbi:hypothetical protein MPDQ_005037 [Monascus purpureus]|uniref:Uncharacterized protein n=1 Tax=Monascus purpureus TaxID=5098 RepID=A0A507QJ45_MONPU|nr:hypothetical protein MPDQ_005037 [Monascus purpureus]